MQHFTATNCILHLLLVQTIFLIITKAEDFAYENGTSNISPGSERLKRSPDTTFPKILEAMVIDKRGKFIHIKWHKTNQYLANEYLPVWIAGSNKKYELKPNVIKSIGRFAMYRDLRLSSAVLYIENTRTLWGVIDTQYYINGLPVDLLKQCHRVGQHYIKRTSVRSYQKVNRPRPLNSIIKSFANCDIDDVPSVIDETDKYDRPPVWIPNFESVYNDRLFDFNTVAGTSLHTRKQVRKRDIKLKQHNISSIRRRRNLETPHYYVETLLLVGFDIIENIKKTLPQTYLTNIVIGYICYFNAIDMLMAKIPTDYFNVHMNLAGIIIEDDKDIFSSMMDYPSVIYTTYQRIIDTDDFASKILEYTYKHDFPFKKNSFDYIVFSTSYKISNDITVGLTWSEDENYLWRQYNDNYNVVPITILQFSNPFENHPGGAHEVGHALGVAEHDSGDLGVPCPGHQCYSIMQETAPHCFICLQWSKESLVQLTKFFSQDRDRCFLLNFPRSLSANGPQVFLTSNEQCVCYGYSHYQKKSNRHEDICEERLRCLTKKNRKVYTILPLDGTVCDVEGKKVCWEKKCVEIKQNRISSNEE